jgi:hypothetical protein
VKDPEQPADWQLKGCKSCNNNLQTIGHKNQQRVPSEPLRVWIGLGRGESVNAAAATEISRGGYK